MIGMFHVSAFFNKSYIKGWPEYWKRLSNEGLKQAVKDLARAEAFYRFISGWDISEGHEQALLQHEGL